MYSHVHVYTCVEGHVKWCDIYIRGRSTFLLPGTYTCTCMPSALIIAQATSAGLTSIATGTPQSYASVTSLGTTPPYHGQLKSHDHHMTPPGDSPEQRPYNLSLASEEDEEDSKPPSSHSVHSWWQSPHVPGLARTFFVSVFHPTTFSLKLFVYLYNYRNVLYATTPVLCYILPSWGNSLAPGSCFSVSDDIVKVLVLYIPAGATCRIILVLCNNMYRSQCTAFTIQLLCKK